MSLPATPSQTIGPFFHIGLDVPGTERLVSPEHPGAVRIEGRVFDGAGDPINDALIEVWDPQGGRFGRSHQVVPVHAAFALSALFRLEAVFLAIPFQHVGGYG